MSEKQWSFEFRDWQEAFKFFYGKRLGVKIYDDKGKLLGKTPVDDSLVFIISRDAYTSGYWIEPDGAELGEGDEVYKSVAEVKRLERRVRYRIGNSKNLSIGLVT